MLALITDSEETTNKVIKYCFDHGVLLFWLLFESKAIRLTPPLTISISELDKACNIILEAFNNS